MDSNLMSCPTCGHTVNTSTGNCTYCGAVISERGDKVDAGDKIAAEETPATPPEPAGQPEAMPLQAVETSENFDNSETAAAKPPESILAPKTSAESVAAGSAEPAADGEPSAEAPAAAEEIEHEDTATEKEQAAAADPAALRPSGESQSSPGIASTATEEPAVVSLSEHMSAGNLIQEDQTPAEEIKHSGGSTHQAVETQPKDEPDTEELPVSPATEVLDRTVEEAEESENLEAEIAAMIENRLSDEDAEPRAKASDERTSADITAVATQGHTAADRQPNAAQESAAEKADSLISEASEDTILLDTADEVRIPAGETSGKTTGEMKMESATPKAAAKAGSGAAAEPPEMPPDILKIENAARKMAAEIKKQKEKLVEVGNSKDEKAEKAKALMLKRQKAALAKAQAQKKQQLMLAKAAAFKRKKASEAKAQALNKKKASPAGGQTPKIEKAAADSRQQGASTAIARSPDANSKMQDLLKKYEGQAIGINYDNSADIREALLEKANHEYFSVFVKDKQLHYSYPLKTILTVIEGKDGVETGGSKQPHKFKAVIKVYPLVLF